MICGNCGTDNPEGRKFCGECGNPLLVACPNCGTPNEPQFKFCGECGTELRGESSTVAAPVAFPAQVTTPTSERRLVSILFADLVGFTTISETRDPDEVRDLLSRYFDEARRIITRYGGTVEKFIGDAVMAVWGTPVAQEDDAERAVRAGLDLTAAVESLAAEVGVSELRARIGVLTGEAAVTIGAEGYGMVAGDLVNTASRIQSVAEPGTVLVGEATRRTTEAAVLYEPAGEHELKGKAEPVPLFRAVRVIGGLGGALRSTAIEAPFVGRERELRLVKDLFHSSAEERRAHLLSVIGIAGIGKSRLAWEFYKYIDGLQDLVYWHRGRCLSYGEGVTYWALAEMVRFRARIAEGEDPASASQKLRAVVAEFVPDPEERAWIEPRLAHLLALEDRTAGEPEDLFSAWRLFFERLSEAQPVALVFEDMQWADPSLLDFVEYLLTWSRGHPLFVMVLARPELTDRHPEWATGRRGSTALHLEPLSESEMGLMLRGLIPEIPDSLERQILDRAEGVPLYAMETVRMLLDRGMLEQEGSAYRLAGPVETLEVPETLHALIAARLDGLTAEERSLAQDASVVGKTFTSAALVAVTGSEEGAVEPILTSLVRKEILGVQADPRSPERGQYGFLQDLVRRVAYETLSRKERRARHLAAAAHLEETYADDPEVVEVVASHYLEAYRAAPDDAHAAEIKARAREALTQAGRRSQSLAASQSAHGYFVQAIELADEPRTRAELHELAGRAAFASGVASQIRAHLEEAISIFEAEGDRRAAARIVAKLAEVAFGDGKFEEALSRMREAHDVLSADEPDRTLAVLVSQMARLLFFTNRGEEAQERIEQALQLAEQLELPEVFAQALNTKSLILFGQGRRQEAILLLRHALEVAVANDLGSAANRAYVNLGSLLIGLDRLQEAEDLMTEALALARRYGERTWEMKIGTSLAGLDVLRGRWDKGVAAMAEAREDFDLAAFQGIWIETLPLVHVYANRGQVEEARTHLASFPGVEDVEEVQMRVWLAVSRGEIAATEGPPEAALAAAEETIRVGMDMGVDGPGFLLGMWLLIDPAMALGRPELIREELANVDALRPGQLTPSLRALSTRARARLAAVDGKGEDPAGLFRAAAAAYEEIGLPFYRAVVLLEWAEWLLATGRMEEAGGIVADARVTFEELGAAPWVARVERVEMASAPAPAASAEALRA